MIRSSSQLRLFFLVLFAVPLLGGCGAGGYGSPYTGVSSTTGTMSSTTGGTGISQASNIPFNTSGGNLAGTLNYGNPQSTSGSTSGTANTSGTIVTQTNVVPPAPTPDPNGNLPEVVRVAIPLTMKTDSACPLPLGNGAVGANFVGNLNCPEGYALASGDPNCQPNPPNSYGVIEASFPASTTQWTFWCCVGGQINSPPMGFAICIKKGQ